VVKIAVKANATLTEPNRQAEIAAKYINKDK
jgi:hypothetical protein